VRNLHGRPPTPPWEVAEPEPPLLDPAELYGLIPEDFRHQTDARELIARIVDGSRFHEFKQLYGETLVTGFARIEGYPGRDHRQQRRAVRAVVAERRALHRALLQAPRPARLPPEHHRLHGGTEYEAGGIARDGAKLVMAVANARVPKFTVVTGGSFGAATTPCADAPSSRGSSGCGRTRASR
jgi:Acetyl-CoA carboxylase, carboxyltransferase component (subunits alpha and beta)